MTRYTFTVPAAIDVTAPDRHSALDAALDLAEQFFEHQGAALRIDADDVLGVAPEETDR